MPLDNKLAMLAASVEMFDASVGNLFDLHTYVLFKNGDILAVEKLLNIKGYNRVQPCCSCNIQGVHNISVKGTIYYIPLRTPHLIH